MLEKEQWVICNNPEKDKCTYLICPHREKYIHESRCGVSLCYGFHTICEPTTPPEKKNK
jgi:hypothetical protein